MFLCPSVLQLCLLVGLHLLCLLLLLPDSSLCVTVAKKEPKPGHAAVLDHFTTTDEANCSSACLVSPECHANGWYVFWKKSSTCFLINCSNTSSCKNISVDSVLAQLGETDGVHYNYTTAQDSSDSNSTTEKQFRQPPNNTLSSSSSLSSDLTKVSKLPELSNISQPLSLSSDSFHSSSDSTSSERGSNNNGLKFSSGNSKSPQRTNNISLSSSGSDQEPVNQPLNDSLPPPPPPPLSKTTPKKLTVSLIQSKEILKLPNQSRQFVLEPDEPSSQAQHPGNQLSDQPVLLPSTQSSKPAINYHPEASLQPSKQPLPLSTTVTQSTTIFQPRHDKVLTSSPTEAANSGSTTKIGTNKPLTAKLVSTTAIHTTQPGKNTITDATVTGSVAARTPPPASTTPTTSTKTTAAIPTPTPPATSQKTTTPTTKITATVKTTIIITSVPAIKEPASSPSSSLSPATQEPKAPTTEMPLVRFTSASPVGTPATTSHGTGPSASTTDNNQVVAKGTRVSVVEVAGDALTSHLVDTASLLAVLLFGLLFFLVTVAVFVTQAYESYRRKDYTQVDYLINGMYTDSGV